LRIALRIVLSLILSIAAASRIVRSPSGDEGGLTDDPAVWFLGANSAAFL
jgi:hypothetical protein